MNIKVNGQDREFNQALTGEALLKELNIAPSAIVAELNGEIIRREAFLTTELNDGDVLELVTVVGGG